MMKKLGYFILFCSVFSFAQTYRITYKSFFEGKARENQDAIILYTNAAESYLTTAETEKGTKKVPFEMQKTDWNTLQLSQFAFLKDQKIAEFTSEFKPQQVFELKPDTKKVLGYVCKKAVTSVNSNTIELWYTDQLKVKGGPTALGQNLGLVLEMVRNGNAVTRATEIKKVKQKPFANILKGNLTDKVDELTYKDLLWRNRFTTVEIFKDETINFTGTPVSSENILRFANGTVILRKVRFPEVQPGDNIFAELTEQSQGDAYDRTGSVFIIPEGGQNTFFDALSKGIDQVPAYENGDGKVYKGIVRTDEYEPYIELMRFFTPFGISQFNTLKLKGKDWHNRVSYRQDITELLPQLSGKELWTGVYIGNYDKGGHKVSLEITVHNDGLNVFKTNRAIPVFNTVNVMEMAGQTYPTLFGSEKGLTVDFTLTKDLKNASLRYITTGHGGWGNGDEFVPKENRIFIDGRKAHAFTPWRTDCGSYRLYNPASGNFSTGLSSSDLSRSNWCPGTLTNPVYIPLGDLKAGHHTIQVQIPQGASEGSSFSYWNVSGVLLGTEAS